MERPHANIEQPIDEHDHELIPVQADAIALAEELLKHKEEGSPVTFVEIILVDNPQEMLAEIESGPLRHLLAAPDEQLATWSDGTHYPKLDMRKEIGSFTGMRLHVWGWDYDKLRYTNPDQERPPYDYKDYPGEKDRTRKIELSIGYAVGEQSVSEKLSVYASTVAPNYIHAFSQLSMPAYAEMGYEGHGGKNDDEISDQAIEWFLEFIARHVGDDPKSYHDLVVEKLQELRESAKSARALTAFNGLIKAAWDEQALSLMERRCYLLDGKTIAQGLQDPELASQAADALRKLNKQYRTYKKNGQLDEGDEWVIALGY